MEILAQQQLKSEWERCYLYLLLDMRFIIIRLATLSLRLVLYLDGLDAKLDQVITEALKEINERR